MHWFEWLDNRTLMASECVTIAVFGAFMFGLRSFHPKLSGITPIAVGFLFGIPGIFLILTEDLTSTYISLVLSSAFVFLSCACLNIGIYQFAHNQARRSTTIHDLRRTRWWHQPQSFLAILIPVYCICLLVIIYFTQFRVEPLPCVLAMTFPIALTRAFMARNLFVIAQGSRQILWFASTTAVFGAFTAARGIRSFFVPLPLNFLGHHTTDVPGLMLALVFLCIQGLFYMLLFANEVTQTVHDEAQLDHLTGILNRRGIEQALEAEVARTWRNGGELAVLLIDIDHFKAINDSLGHAAGDEALRRVVASIARTIRLYDRLGRYGGDEFLLLLPQTTQYKAVQTASRILEGMRDDATSAATGASLRPMTLSIGVTCCAYTEEVGEIIARADSALYRAKNAGRDNVCFQSRVDPDAPDSISDSVDDALLVTGADGTSHA
jgi:diguanylate cyclase (GGDEF)-like protein